MANQDHEKKLMEQYLSSQHDETRKTLDYLRKTRKSRGGTGAPLQVPSHLKDAAAGKPSIILDEKS